MASVEGCTDRAGHLHVAVGVVLTLGSLLLRLNHAGCLRVDQHNVCRFAFGKRAALLVVQATNLRGLLGEDTCHIAPGNHAGVNQGHLDDGQCLLQAGHTVRGARPLAFLGLCRVRCVVGTNHVDDAVSNSLAQRHDVLFGAQRRVHLEHRVVGACGLVGEQQVVRGCLRGHLHAAGLSPAHNLNGALGGQVADVQLGVQVLSQQHVAGNDCLFSDGGPAGQAQVSGHLTFVHLGAFGQARLLRVLCNNAVEGLDVFEGAAHHGGVVHAHAVVREHAHVRGGVRHAANVGEALALQTHGHCADGLHAAPCGFLAEAVNLLNDCGGVCHGHGVCHGEHCGVAAQGCCAGAGLDGFGCLVAGLTQVGVNVDQAGQRHLACRLDYLCVCCVNVLCDAANHAVLDEDVGDLFAVEACALDQVLAHGVGSSR